MPDKDYNENAKTVFLFWKSVGFTDEQACGMVAQADAESSFNIKATGDSGRAYGIHQWHPDRIELMFKGTGIDIRKFPPLTDQLKASWWELNNNEHRALYMMRTAKTAYEAGALACKYYERPARQSEQEKRGKKAEYWYNYFKQNKIID